MIDYSEYQEDSKDSTYKESAEGKLTPIEFAKKHKKDDAIKIIEEAISDKTQDDHQYFNKDSTITGEMLYIETDISKELISDATETSALEVLTSLDEQNQIEQFKYGLSLGALANPAIRCFFNYKDESNLECFFKGIERSIGNAIFLKNLNLEPIVGTGFKSSITAKILIDSYYDKAAFNIHYGLELAQYTIVSFASISIPSTLLSYKIVTDPFALGFMINTLPAVLDPAINKLFEETYSLTEYVSEETYSLTQYVSNEISSITGYCSTNTGADELA